MEDNRDDVLVKVKFKGSKLATGSSKMPNAIVKAQFMQKLTPMNAAMIVNTLALSSKKKKVTSVDASSSENNISSKKKKVSSTLQLVEDDGIFAQSSAPPEPLSEVNAKKSILSIDDVIESDHTLGGLCLPAIPASYSGSEYYATALSNKRQLQKMVEGLQADADAIPIKCDFDFWLWIEAQNTFAPFSYKTHDVSILALEDIGQAEVLRRWRMPELQLEEEKPVMKSLANENYVRLLGIEPVYGNPVTSQLLAGSASAVADHSSYSNSSSDGDINVVSSNSNSNSVNNNSRNMTYNNCDSSFGSSSGSSSSRTKEESSACGVDDGPDEESYPYFKPHPADHQSTEAGLFGLDEHLTQLEKRLRQQILWNNERKATLRRRSLQAAPVRHELDEAQKEVEREKAVLVRWRKSKAYIPVGGRSVQSNGQGGSGGHRNNSTNTAGGAGGGWGGAAAAGCKPRPSHRKKLGGY